MFFADQLQIFVRTKHPTDGDLDAVFASQIKNVNGQGHSICDCISQKEYAVRRRYALGGVARYHLLSKYRHEYLSDHAGEYLSWTKEEL